jgi:signal transduction histidine kinase
MFAVRFVSRLRGAPCCGLISSAALLAAHADEPVVPPALLEITNVHQLHSVAAQTPGAAYAIRLEGDVWWSNPTKGRLVLKDSSGAEELFLDLSGHTVEAGERIRLAGPGTVTRTDGGFRIGLKGPVVDNDGVHGMIEKTGGAYLKAGRNPIRVDWFNGVEKYGLEVEYQGPGLARQRIPDSVLFRMEVDETAGVTNWVSGLGYQQYGVAGQALPDWSVLTPVDGGQVSNFDLRVLERGSHGPTNTEHVGLSFTGFLEVPRDGLYTFYTRSDDGSRIFVGRQLLDLQSLGRAAFPKPIPLAIGEILTEDQDGQWAQVEGKVTFVSEQPDTVHLELSGGPGRVRVEIPDRRGLTPTLLLNKRVRAIGYGQAAYTLDGQKALGVLLVPSGNQIQLLEPLVHAEESLQPNEGKLPLLTTASEVHRLRREEAQRGYSVKLRGVITSVLPEHQAFTIQDSSRGLYVIDFSASRSDPPKIGETLEIEGRTDPSLFAPVVYAERVSSLGSGSMPEPARPTWDQVLNGSLDAQYVEIQGILTDIKTNQVVLLTRDGTLKVEIRMNGMKPEDLRPYEDALVRIRGCLLASWDYVTYKVNVGEIKIYGADVAVDQPAPVDLFSVPRKVASDLLSFDPQASVFQRVKVSGVVLQMKGAEGFMVDSNTGVRFMAKRAETLQAGDLVEAVGFPELGSASPLLREAVVRKTGHGTLPAPRELSQPELSRANNDSTRVRINAVLVNQRGGPLEQSLEMQAGPRTFFAWLPTNTIPLQPIPVGSKLQLTGTYVSEGGNRAANQRVASFELLLDSPLDIVLVARPPWWTLERLLVILGSLACVLAMTVLWITQLRRKVEQRTRELEVQIQERQRVEQQHALEQERARIAQDLHDELGSGLTEITMLGARARPLTALDGKRSGYLDQMNVKAREMVAALDEIVWAMNPAHDSMASLVSYFSVYADRFLNLANIAWRLEGPGVSNGQVLDARHRHQLFLAFKEALTNVVHHSGASEVRFNAQVQNGQLHLRIADNGRGFPGDRPNQDMNGIANMKARIENLGGRFEVESKPGHGTTLRFHLPTT